MPIPSVESHYDALSQALIKNQHETVVSLLAAMRELGKEDQVKILQQLNEDDCNLLMLAVWHAPVAVAPILTMIKEFSKEDQVKILKQSAANRHNALMLAARKCPEAVEPILAVMKELDVKERTKILMRHTKGDLSNPAVNVLVLAAKPPLITPILLAMLELGAKEQAQIIEQYCATRDWYGRIHNKSVLTLAAKYFPDSLGPILSAIGRENLAQALKKIASDQYASKSLDHILVSMQALRVEEQAELLKQFNPNGFNPLMIAVDKYPQALEGILLAMENLKVEDQAHILKQCVTSSVLGSGYNALMLAALRCPKAVAPILTAIRRLSVEDQACILKQCAKEGFYFRERDRYGYKDYEKYNALMLAARLHPEAVAPILAAIEVLKVEDQALILKQHNDDGRDALMLAKMTAKIDKSPIPLATYEVEMRLLLIKLNEKISEFERLSKSTQSPRYTLAHQQAVALYGKLHDSLAIYQGAERSKASAETLSRVWKKEINAAKKSILVEFPDVKEILRGMVVLVASIVILPYGVYRALNHYQQNKSLFFTTKTEQMLDELEKAPRDLSKKSIEP